MIPIVEKVAWLKPFDIFVDTPDYVLAAVARIAEEVRLQAGETFIRQGEPGECLYLVKEGRVRVHIDDHIVDTLGPGFSVGELAVLDPGPRSASVTAEDRVYLFRIDKIPFEEAMADRPEIAKGIIRALSRRLRRQASAGASLGQKPADYPEAGSGA